MKYCPHFIQAGEETACFSHPKDVARCASSSMGGGSGLRFMSVSSSNTNSAGIRQQASPPDEIECRVVIEVRQRWATSGYSPLRRIKCECVHRVLIIHGVVPSYFFKQMAQETIRSVNGIDKIVNELNVMEGGGIAAND